jgi:hypothetical protein
MKKRLPIGRTIASVIAGVLFFAGVFLLVEAYLIRKEFYRQVQTRPLDLRVDLSQPNEYTVPFKQTWRACHGQTINLHVPAMAETHVSPSDLLAPDGKTRETWTELIRRFSGAPPWGNGAKPADTFLSGLALLPSGASLFGFQVADRRFGRKSR